MRRALGRLFVSWRVLQGAKPIRLYLDGAIEADDYARITLHQGRAAARRDRAHYARTAHDIPSRDLGSPR